jgi:hypothetical protein
MRNIKRIQTFLPDGEFEGMGISDLIPSADAVNEALSDGRELDGMPLSDVKVSDWLWDFKIERKSFPKASSFTDLVDPDQDLSVFTAQVVNTFAINAWKAIKTKKIINSSITEKEREKIKSKLQGFWRTRKKLDLYKQEKEALAEYIAAFEEFLMNGELGASIQEASDSIILSKGADPMAGPISKIVTNLKSFFTKSTWQNAVSWLISNIANNNQYVKWLNTTVYEPNTLSSGTSPDVTSAFDSFVTNSTLEANVPSMENAMSGIKTVTKLAIERSKKLPQQGAETWMGCLYNTYLFGLYQKMLIIGCCAWVYDIIGDTDIMSSKSIIPTPKTDDEKVSTAPSTDLEVGEHNGVKVYKVSYLSPTFKEILNSLLDGGQIGSDKYQEYMNRIDSKKDSRSIIRSVRMDVLGWGNRHGFRRTDRPEVKGLYTDGSTRLIIPIEMFKKLVG